MPFTDRLQRFIQEPMRKKEFMGLPPFAVISRHSKKRLLRKNYLNEKELRAMGQLVSGYLDFAERQAERTGNDDAGLGRASDRILTMSGEF